jgi:hypothetical protein
MLHTEEAVIDPYGNAEENDGVGVAVRWGVGNVSG